MKKPVNNDLININKLEKGKTGNADLDNAFAEMNNSPIVFSSEEALHLVENAIVNDATSSVIKNTIILGGAVLVSAIFGWMYYQYNSTQMISTNSYAQQENKTIIVEKNKLKLSSTDEDSYVAIAEENNNSRNNNSGSNSNSNTAITSEEIINPSLNNNSTKKVNNNLNSNKNVSIVGGLNTSEKISSQQLNDDSKKSNSNFSKTIITQRYFDDGSAKMTLEYKNQPARITINSRGIESLIINEEEVDPSNYYLYDDLATEAFRRSKIEPLAMPTNDANTKPNISAMMTGALVRRCLIKNGEKFSFELTASTAILNNTNLKSDIQKDLLQVYQNAFGSSLPRGGKFIIGKQQ
jgi:hypothetical protein